MSKWISGDKVLEKIEDEQLLNYLGKGLQPYSSPEQQPIPCESRRHKANYLFESRHKKISARLRAIDYFLHFGSGFSEQPEANFPVNSYDWLTFETLLDLLDSFTGQEGLEALTPDDIEKLRVEKAKAEEELVAVESEIEAIVDDDPEFQDWRYFVIPDAKEEVQEVVSSLAEALFKHEDFEKCTQGERVCPFTPFRAD